MSHVTLSNKHVEELTTLRRDFHKHPERGLEEFRTADTVQRYLSSLGLDVKRVATTGVVGVLEGRQPGPTLLIRADMDALPLNEETDLPFRSIHQGLMHACGHDAHMAMLLVAAKVIVNQCRDQITGTIKFVFQPNEEAAGAYLMIREGVLEDPTVDAAATLHIWSLLDSWSISITEGPVMAAARYFKLTILGRGGHAGLPHQSICPIDAAVNVIQATKSIVTHETDPLRPTVVVTTSIQAGTNPTIVPSTAVIEGSLRWLSPDDEGIESAFRRIVDATCAAHRVEYELTIEQGNHVVQNDPKMTAVACVAAHRIKAFRHVLADSVSTMAGDDFGEFSHQIPSVYCFLGSRNEEKGTAYPHHHPRFNIDEAVLPLGAVLHANVAVEFFRRGGVGRRNDSNPDARR